MNKMWSLCCWQENWDYRKLKIKQKEKKKHNTDSQKDRVWIQIQTFLTQTHMLFSHFHAAYNTFPKCVLLDINRRWALIRVQPKPASLFHCLKFHELALIWERKDKVSFLWIKIILCIVPLECVYKYMKINLYLKMFHISYSHYGKAKPRIYSFNVWWVL